MDNGQWGRGSRTLLFFFEKVCEIYVSCVLFVWYCYIDFSVLANLLR